MNTKARLVTTAALLAASAAYGAPFLAVGDGAEIFLTGTVEARADSNVYMAPSTTKNRDDVILVATPGLEWAFGKNSAIQGTWSIQEALSSFSDHSDLNSSLFSTNFSSSYSDGKTKGTFNASYAETNQNQVDDTASGPLDFLIDRKTTTVDGKMDLNATEKTKVAAGLKYVFTNYSRAGFNDSEIVTVPIDFYYEVTPKIDLGVGYQLRESWQQGKAPDSTDNFLHLSTRGDFTPKLSGTINVGYTQRNYKHIEDVSLLGIDANLSYVASPKTTLQLGATNDFDTNSQGQQQKNLAFNASSTTKLSEQWSVNLMASYRAINYFQLATPRTDDYMTAKVGASYIVNAYATISAAYNYSKNRSDLASSRFDGNILSIMANLRY